MHTITEALVNLNDYGLLPHVTSSSINSLQGSSQNEFLNLAWQVPNFAISQRHVFMPELQGKLKQNNWTLMSGLACRILEVYYLGELSLWTEWP